MVDTASRLVGPTQLVAAAATVYTVPALTTAIIKHIRLTNDTATDRTVTMSIGADASGTRIYSEIPIPAHSVFVEDTWIVLAAAEILQAFASAASAINLTVSGVLIT